MKHKIKLDIVCLCSQKVKLQNCRGLKICVVVRRLISKFQCMSSRTLFIKFDTKVRSPFFCLPKTPNRYHPHVLFKTIEGICNSLVYLHTLCINHASGNNQITFIFNLHNYLHLPSTITYIIHHTITSSMNHITI